MRESKIFLIFKLLSYVVAVVLPQYLSKGSWSKASVLCYVILDRAGCITKHSKTRDQNL